MTKKLEQITRKYLETNYVDIVGGIFSLKSLEREITYQLLNRPWSKELIVHTIRNEKGYYSTIYIKKSDFKNRSKVK